MYPAYIRQRAVARYRFLIDRNPESPKTGIADRVGMEFGISGASVRLWSSKPDRTASERASDRQTHSLETIGHANASELPILPSRDVLAPRC